MLHTDSSMNNSSSLDSMPSLPNTNIAYNSKYKGGDPHGNIRQRGKITSGLNVVLKNIVRVFWKISDHSVVTPIVTNLWNEYQ